MALALVAASLILVLFSLRILLVLKHKLPQRRSTLETCRTAVFLGSGGHTSEMLQLLKGMNFERYKPRIYIISEGDQFSAAKAAELEFGPNPPSPPSIITIPRARKVLQPLRTVPFTAAISLYGCLLEMTIKPLYNGQPFADLLLLNGPGTCVIIVLAAYFNRFFGIPSPHLIYIESFTRVKKLSLSGRILRPFVDSFIVQWPELLQDGKRGTYTGPMSTLFFFTEEGRLLSRIPAIMLLHGRAVRIVETLYLDRKEYWFRKTKWVSTPRILVSWEWYQAHRCSMNFSFPSANEPPRGVKFHRMAVWVIGPMVRTIRDISTYTRPSTLRQQQQPCILAFFV